ncbi:MAG: DUF4238 domain-containing protein [Ignavibacteriales bacterium]|nr:DUF4238 domain-containing protein [Ignavibacteriales bacterium]
MSKRRQHYVPRFYLRNFALENVKQINLYHIGNQKLYKNVSLREQCYVNNFYGLDNENMLAELENSFSIVIKYVLLSYDLPDIKNAYRYLFAFVAVQLTRTKKFADQFNSSIEKFNQLVLLRNQEQFPNIDVKKIRIGLKDPVLETLPYSYKILLSIEDLRCHLLLANGKDIGFITSDSPIFIYNKYIEDLKNAKNGLLSEGVIIFVPLSPQVCLVLYDSSVYKVGKSNQNKTINLTEDDIFQINAMQFINADQSLYFNNLFGIDYFIKIHQKYFQARELAIPKVLEYQEGENINKSIVVNYIQMPKLNLSLSFLSIRRNAKRIKKFDRNLRLRKAMPSERGEIKKVPNKILKDKEGILLKKINEL